MRTALTEAREENPMVRLRELKKLLDALDDDAKAARQRTGEELGRYWHGRQLRERRSFPAEQRDRALYKMSREQTVAALGWEITEDDFVMLQQTVRSERKRRNRLGLPWTTRDPATGQEVLTLEVNLMQLPSYREHQARERTMSKQIVKKGSGKLAKRPSGELEPLKQVPHDDASIMDWFRRFDALPVKQKNKVIRDNPEVLSHLYGARVPNGDLLIGPLAAENQGNRDEGEFAFLVSLKPLRDRLVKEYEINTAAEFMLVDALVLSYYQYIRASGALHTYIAYGKTFNYETLVRYAQTYLARANELFLRNLEAMRQMKAAPFIIKIEQAGQVNVGEKQINVAGKPAPGTAEVLLARGNSGEPALSAASAGPRALPEPDDSP